MCCLGEVVLVKDHVFMKLNCQLKQQLVEVNVIFLINETVTVSVDRDPNT